MRDWISDWKKWSRVERCFAILLVIIALVLPLGLLIVGVSNSLKASKAGSGRAGTAVSSGRRCRVLGFIGKPCLQQAPFPQNRLGPRQPVPS